LLGYIAQITTPICEISATKTLNFHHRNIMSLTSLEPNCHLRCFANGLTVSNFLLLLKEPLFFAHLK